jgi:hypothetical protein
VANLLPDGLSQWAGVNEVPQSLPLEGAKVAKHLAGVETLDAGAQG